MKKLPAIFMLLVMVLPGCAAPPTLPAAPADTPAPAPSLTVTPLPTATATATLTATPTIYPTPDPYWEYSIEYLRSRAYGEGTIESTEVLGQNVVFTRHLFRYDSDDLSIHGFANVPHSEGPFPVIIALHGYIDPEIYNTFDYTTHYADALASAEYLVLHPNLRGYRPSDDGDNLFRVGMAIDVLNLIAHVQEQAGQPGLLETADPQRIGLWGHSMGGGISTRVLTVSHDIDGAVLYAAMTGDERKNFEAINRWSDFERGLEELAVPTETLARISPMYYFEDITAPVSIHHGLADQLVPVQWSMQTCDELRSLGKDVECHYYEDMPHTFYGPGDKEFIQYTLQFFNEHLAAP